MVDGLATRIHKSIRIRMGSWTVAQRLRVWLVLGQSGGLVRYGVS